MIYYFNPPFIAFVLKKVTVTLCRAYPLFSTCERTYQFFFLHSDSSASSTEISRQTTFTVFIEQRFVRMFEQTLSTS